jgi:5-methylcytosine-specific restriction endonuclease McrA
MTTAIRAWHRRQATRAEVGILRSADAVRVARYHTHRAEKLGIPGRIDGGFVALLWVAQDARCFYCGARLDAEWPDDKWDLEHVIPLSAGGTNEPHNIVLACRRCNCTKGGRPPLDWIDKPYGPARAA